MVAMVVKYCAVGQHFHPVKAHVKVGRGRRKNFMLVIGEIK